MDLILLMVAVSLVVITGFGIYSMITNHIIKEQDRDIRRLQTENNKLRRALQARNNKKAIQTPASTTEAKYEPIRCIPDYPNSRQEAKAIERDSIGGY